jgi:palmitoyltransferase
MVLLRVPSIERLAIPGVSVLILFLAYTSQYLFYYIDPGPLTKNQALWFNGFVLGIWWCYDRVCTVDPGPRGWVRKVGLGGDEDDGEDVILEKGKRWCRKCEAVKPPRAHHCKQCRRYIFHINSQCCRTLTDICRCIPKMDHHCPWTTNCVSLTTFPHFLRFVLYTVISMSILTYHLFIRVLIIWANRNLPAYLGPPVWTMVHLFVLVLVNSITLFALSILLVRSIYSLAINTTMIESWEIERHEALADRARRTGGYVYTNGQKMRIQRQEFPYDVSIWRNLCEGMGTNIVPLWFLPFGGAPGIGKAVKYEVNGFEDESKSWPPPDPDKMPRNWRPSAEEVREYESREEEIEAFKKRQRKDYERWGGKTTNREEIDDSDEGEYESEYEEGMDGEEGWTNSEGDRLRDYGVDEGAEVLADDDIPLGELLRRRKTTTSE